MREEEKKGIQWRQRVLPMYFCTSPFCEREGIFVALNVSDGCWGNYNMRGLRLFCFLSVRVLTEIFCDGASGFLDRWNCDIEERSQLV